MRPTRRSLAIAGLVAVVAVATPTLATAQAASSASSAATKVSGAAPAADFTSTVALSNCSGSIIRWKSSKPSDTALMLTNGHCYKFFGAREVVVNQPDQRSVDLLDASGNVVGTVQTVKLLYGTMWKTDVSLYSLGLTYQQLQDQYGVPPLTVSDSKASPKDQAISVISGYWRIQYDCHLNGFAYRLHEDVWTWDLSLRYEDGKCQVIGGTSGSPVVNSNRVMIGINNTINEDGQRCTFDNPCEENRRGKITVHLNRGYGQETWLFYTCLDNDNQLDLAKKGCRLPTP